MVSIIRIVRTLVRITNFVMVYQFHFSPRVLSVMERVTV